MTKDFCPAYINNYYESIIRKLIHFEMRSKTDTLQNRIENS